MTAGSGRRLPTPFAWFDPDTCSWRTWQPSLLGASTESSPTWPRSGTWDRGAAYEHPTSAPLTDASGSSSLLKTPTANLGSNGGSQHPDKRKAGGHGPTLADEVEHLLPTPKAQDGKHSTPTRREIDGPCPSHLHIALIGPLLPTPTATPYGSNQSPSPGAAVRPSLNSIGQLLPTPTAAAHVRNRTVNRTPGREHHSGTTLADLVTDGALTHPPSPDGSTSPAAPHPPQPNLAGQASACQPDLWSG